MWAVNSDGDSWHIIDGESSNKYVDMCRLGRCFALHFRS